MPAKTGLKFSKKPVLSSVSPEAAEVDRFGVATFLWRGEEAMVAGTGYTGEDGVETALPNGLADAPRQALLAATPAPAGPAHGPPPRVAAS